MSKFIAFVCAFLFIFSWSSFAFNLRKAGNTHISGSRVQSVFQDKRGLIWLSTNAGLFTYDGKETSPFYGIKGVSTVNQTTVGTFFVETLYGLSLFDSQADSIYTFEMFNNIAFSATDSKGNIFVIQGNGFMYYKTNQTKNFENVIIPGLAANQIKSFFIDSSDTIRIIHQNGVMRSFKIIEQHTNILLKEAEACRLTSANILFNFRMKDHIYIVDEDYQLSMFSLTGYQTSSIFNLKPFLFDKGSITSAVIFKDEFYFGTETGLYVIRNDQVTKVPAIKGITYLLKDKFQDLIWIGTTDDGLYTYSFDLYSIIASDFSTFSPTISKPVTSICNNQGTLWLGTEGEGIICIPDYDPNKEISNIYSLNNANGLPDNTVYSLRQGNGGIWIGCQSGLFFYSSDSKVISKLQTHSTSLKNIRAVYEQDSILWLACYGEGVAQLGITYTNGQPKVNRAKLFSVNNSDPASNRFSSIYSTKKDIWFVNNGNGLYKIDHDTLVTCRFEKSMFNAINDICAINDSDYIAATDFGTIQFSSSFDKHVEASLLNNTAIKDILPGNQPNYWLSTDHGLTLYHLYSNTFRFFDYSYGLNVTEYISGASFKDEESGSLFFGGINGFSVIIRNMNYDEAMDYMPMLYVNKISLYGAEHSIENFKKSDSNELLLQSNENFFSVTFNALDYLHGNNHVYYYKIGSNGQWINNGHSGVISFNELMPGQYKLFVKYYNTVLNKESYTQRLDIRVLPPWYRSNIAYISYFILISFFIYGLVLFLLKRKRKQEEENAFKAEQKRKEEIYEAKLDFFTHIAHELCTPLTLIYGPCNLILQQKNLNTSVLKYAGVIDRNARRMNMLINDLMEFKQIESGYKQPKINRVNVSEIADRLIESFTINTSGAFIQIQKIYDDTIIWNSDENFLVIILTNLLSNAVKYSENASANIEIVIKNNCLVIKVSNKGKGIRKDEIEKIFNKFTIFNHLEKQNGWQQNGLGLAITAGLVKLLQGNIHVDSKPDDITDFIISLPDLPADSITKTSLSVIKDPLKTVVFLPSKSYEYKEDRPSVTIIDDDSEIRWFICDVLNKEFNVIPVNDPLTALETINMNHTDLILCDIMMQGIDGIELTRLLKSDESTSHIPLIAISAAHEIEKQTEAIDAGAELYITKPFSTDYLISTIKRLMSRKEDLKKYFESPLSAYELNMGKLEHKEHRKFLKKVHSIINKNIQNKNLSPDLIASELGISTRSLYRKISEITNVGLQDLIREGKLVTAENLLLKSKFTIDEIIFKSGFSSRASFYRAFSQKHHCSPKEFADKNSQ